MLLRWFIWIETKILPVETYKILPWERLVNVWKTTHGRIIKYLYRIIRPRSNKSRPETEKIARRLLCFFFLHITQVDKLYILSRNNVARDRIHTSPKPEWES